MQSFLKPVCSVLLAAALLQSAMAQVGGGVGGRRNQGGEGINYAPQPAVYAVLSIDADARTIQLRAADGRTGHVQVGASVYDLSKLKAGDKVKVDFVLPDEKNKDLRAAAIWLEN